MKRKTALLSVIFILVFVMLTGFCCSYAVSPEESAVQLYGNTEMPFYENYDGNYDDYYDEYYDEYQDSFEDDYDYYYGPRNEFNKTAGIVLIVIFGYVIPLALIIVSLVAYLKSSSKRRLAWFIMTGVGLITAILATLYMMLTM